MFEFTKTCIGSGNYVCPPEAGPAWRAAYEAGCDMEHLEANLKLTPEDRFLKHHKLRNEWLEFETFIETIYRGLKFIKSNHVYPS
ncbi:MAG: hypothetical protein WDN00_14275 [Limisphaerales bacterium]